MQNSYEKHMESVIEKNMRKQNRLKLNGGGLIEERWWSRYETKKESNK